MSELQVARLARGGFDVPPRTRGLMLVAGLVGLGLVFMESLVGRQEQTIRLDEVLHLSGYALLALVLVRCVHAYVRRELALAEARRRLVAYPAGATLLRQGDRLDRFSILRKGGVEAIRTEGGKAVLRATAGAGEVVGLLGLARGEPQYATVRARTPVELYRMTLDELLDSAGGREQPVALVTDALVRKLREAADRLARTEADSSGGLS